jgi:hypothetical protein
MSTDTQKGFPYTVNGQAVSTRDPTPTGNQLLSDAGFEPADDYILIQRTAHGTKVISSDEVVPVGEGAYEFFAFGAGEAFVLTVNEHSLYWGEEKIKVEQIRTLANVPEDHELVWEREGEKPEVLDDRGLFSMAPKGVEHLRTKERPPAPPGYIYFVDDVEYTTHEVSLTGAQIIARVPDWNPANALVLEGEGSERDEVIPPTASVAFKGRKSPARFIAVPPATFGRA